MTSAGSVTWTPTKIAIADPDHQQVERDAWISDVEPGLAVHTVQVGDHTIWGVTHVASGKAIAKWFVTTHAAKALVLESRMLVNWARSADELSADARASDEVWRLRSYLYASEDRGDFGPVDHDLIAECRLYGRLIEEQSTKINGDAVARRQSR